MGTAKSTRQSSMTPSENEVTPSVPPLEPGPDSAKSPIKQPDSPADIQPEIPKVGTADAPGG
jgi:hypothetical protein